MPDATRALQSIPFSSLIGGPLDAAVRAQAMAAGSSVDFINEVGFDDKGQIKNITFKAKRGGTEVEIEVPLLTIVPIPFIRIDEVNINFKANITASESTSESTSTSKTASVSSKVSGSYWFVKASIDASYSSKKDSSSTKDSRYSVEHTVDVNVHAVQDDMPAGLAKMLNILTETIEQPTQAQGAGQGGAGSGAGTGTGKKPGTP